MRECVEIQVEGLWLRGTFHQPGTHLGSLPPQGVGVGKTGVLLLNSGFLPRSAQGDLSAHLADSMADAGFPVFRFDLPGLGDSEGDLPEDAVTFVRLVEQGAFAPYASTLSAKLTGLYGLDTIIVGGLCGGGITALFAAAAAKGSRIGGVIMSGSRLQPGASPGTATPGINSRGWRWKQSFLLRMKAVYEELRVWILSRRLSAPLQKIYSRVKAARSSRRTASPRPPSHSLPPDANGKLLRSFERLMAVRLPILVVTAQNPRRVEGSFDYLGYMLGKGPGRLDCRKIEGTNHSFVEGIGPKAIRELTEEWLKANFAAEASARPQSVKESDGKGAVNMVPSIEKACPTCR